MYHLPLPVSWQHRIVAIAAHPANDLVFLRLCLYLQAAGFWGELCCVQLLASAVSSHSPIAVQRWCINMLPKHAFTRPAAASPDRALLNLLKVMCGHPTPPPMVLFTLRMKQGMIAKYS